MRRRELLSLLSERAGHSFRFFSPLLLFAHAVNLGTSASDHGRHVPLAENSTMLMSFTPRSQFLIGLFFAALLAMTRSQHWMGFDHLPDASWAVFFLAGVVFNALWVFPAFILEALTMDVIAVTWGGVDNFCVSPAYPFLLPAYAALWFAGRVFRPYYREAWSALLPFGVCAVMGAAVCEVISGGGFYFFSGQFAEPNGVEFASRLMTYFPSSLGVLAMYASVAAGLHAFWVMAQNRGWILRRPGDELV